MTESVEPMDEDEEISEKSLPPWSRITINDLSEINFELPLKNSVAADCRDLRDLYRAAMELGSAPDEAIDDPAARIFGMLSDITGMYFKPGEGNEPFGPMAVFNGCRTAIPSDFRAHVDILGAMAERTTNPVLRARLCDVCWLLDRRLGKLAVLAIASYTEIVEKTDRGELKYRLADNGGVLEIESRDYLRRALRIGRVVGWSKPETLAARANVNRLRDQALTVGDLVAIHWFSDLDLEFGVSNPAEVGADLDRFLSTVPAGCGSHNVIDLWRLAARAYHLAKQADDKNRCLVMAVEALVSEAEVKQGSAILQSHFLSAAIAQLHGVPGQKGRRTALRHKLIDVQARVPEELSSFSHELDVEDLTKKVQGSLIRVDLLDKLFIFADLVKSPDPAKLADDAAKAVRQHPFSSLFGAAHLDHEGKVVHRTSSAGLGGDIGSENLRNKIAQSESVRRRVAVSGMIEPARHLIIGQHWMSDDILATLLQYSPFVPSDLVHTFARAYTRFFQGDFVSATYILAPILENSLRYILKSSGHDVTIFDDANQTQQDRTISSLFEQMRTELDDVLTPAITTEIERVFLERPGPCLRHAVAHGLLHDGDPYGGDAIYACWLIFRLCLLPLFRHLSDLRSMLSGSEFCRG